jgi:arsenite methyltransferase
LLQRRDADNDRVRQHGASLLAGYRDGVLDRATVTDGDVLLDVGTGDGLIGLAALDRVGPGGQVIFSDISADLLAECRRRAIADGRLERCRFVQASAEDLHGVPDRSVDVVMTRSVLIYVRRKQAALGEFFRTLRPGGRLSIFEPINSFAMAQAGGDLLAFDVAAVADLAAKVRPAYLSVPSEQDPMLNFDERDLLRWARAAGFAALELDYRAEVEVPEPPPTTDHRLGGTEKDHTQPAGSDIREGAGPNAHRSRARPLRGRHAQRPGGRYAHPQDARHRAPARHPPLTARGAPSIDPATPIPGRQSVLI